MKWSELDDKERTRLVLQHVMGYFALEATSTGWRTPELARGINAPAGFHWPIAFWNTDGECWMTKDIATDPTFFDPLHDMNHAWKIITWANSLPNGEIWRFDRILESLIQAKDKQRRREDVLPFLRPSIVYLTPDLICRVALKFVGVVE
jgi:hypothetical protein